MLETVRPRLAQGLEHIFHLAVGLLPLALCFWCHQVVVPSSSEEIYLAYDGVLLYLSDGAAVAAVAAWAGRRLLGGRWEKTRSGEPRANSGSALRWIFLLVAALAGVSVVWSTAPVLSLHTALHLALMLGLFVALEEEPQAWRFIALGSLAALVLEAGIAVAQFSAQTTAFLAPLGLTWAGAASPDAAGVSVVELADGSRWLRSYGTLPHPNILGGWTIALMAAPLAAFLREGNARWRLLAPAALGSVCLVLSFSRSAWLGAAAGAGVMLTRRRLLPRGRILALGAVVLVSVLVTAVPLRQLVYTRLVDLSVHTEARSLRQRHLLGEEAVELITWRPLLGTGAGAFVPTLVARSSRDVTRQPDHNVLRLVTAELGVGGAALSLAAGAVLLDGIRKARTMDQLMLSAAVVGVIVAAQFDHYIWSLPPGRTMFTLLLGAAAGQFRRATGVQA